MSFDLRLGSEFQRGKNDFIKLAATLFYFLHRDWHVLSIIEIS